MEDTNGDKIKTHERLACLETKVETIMNNHLPHIEKAIKDLKTDIEGLGAKFWAIIIGLILILGGMIANLLQ